MTEPRYPQHDPDVLLEEERKEARANLARRVLIAVAFVLGLGILVGVLILLSAIRDTQLEGTPLGKRLEESANTIESCTSTDGKCAKRNQRETAELIAGLVDADQRSAAAAAACAAKPAIATVRDTDERAAAILACMTGLIQPPSQR